LDGRWPRYSGRIDFFGVAHRRTTPLVLPSGNRNADSLPPGEVTNMHPSDSAGAGQVDFDQGATSWDSGTHDSTVETIAVALGTAAGEQAGLILCPSDGAGGLPPTR
jgi:hypothetical protein